MKVINISLLIILSCLILSCGDDPFKPEIKPESGKIRVIKESTGKSPEGYYAEVYQILKVSNVPVEENIISLYTNPGIDAVTFRYKLNEVTDVSLMITNPVKGEEFSIYKGKLNPGSYSQTFKFSDSVLIVPGTYTAYLFLNKKFNDYIYFIYYSLSKPLLFEDKSLYLLGTFSSGLQENTVKVTENYYNLKDKKINLTNFQGIFEKTVIFSDSLKIKVFDKDSQKIGEINTSIDVLENTGILLKI